MIKNQQNQVKTIKTNELFESSFASAPMSFWQNITKMCKTSINLCANLYPYFCSETGRKTQHKEFTISELRFLLGTKEKIASRNSIEKASKELKELGLFLINENFLGKEKTITFYLPNKKNQELFDLVEKNEGAFLVKPFEFYQKNNIINLDFHYQKNESQCQKFDSECQKNDTEIQKKVKTCQKFDSDKNPEILINNEVQELSTIPQDHIHKDYLYKDHSYKEEKNEMNDFKNFDNEQQKIIDRLEAVNINTSKLKNLEAIFKIGFSNINDLIKETNFKFDSGVIKNKEGFLMSLIKKALSENKNDSYELSTKEENLEFKNKMMDFLKYCHSKKYILSLSHLDKEYQAIKYCLDRADNISFVNELKNNNTFTIEEIKELLSSEFKDLMFKKKYQSKLKLFLQNYGV